MTVAMKETNPWKVGPTIPKDIDPTVEQLYNLPPDLVVPKYHKPYPSKDFDDTSILRLEPDSKGWLTVIMEDGKCFRVERPEDILLLFPNKYNWVYSKFNELDCITKPLNKYQRIELYLLNETTIDYMEHKFQLHWILDTGKVTLMVDNSTKTTRYLINAASFTSKDSLLTTFTDIRKLVNRLQLLSEFCPVNLLSLAATAKNYILDFAGREFKIVDALSIPDLTFIHSCYKGPRMETKYLGTLVDRENIDMTKAYLKALTRVPAFYKNIVKIYRGSTQFFEDAHPGSAYLVKVTVPIGYSSFPPIPFKFCNGIRYPQGTFTSYLSKPYIDLLREMGDIPFEILDSLQFIMLDDKNLPFKKGLGELEKYEDENTEKLFPINLKSLHFTMVGHFLHYHKDIDSKTGNSVQKASNDYHPSLSLAMQGMVATELWKMSQVYETDAIRVDALTGKDLPILKGFKVGTRGQMTFLTANLKDKPGSTLYRDKIVSDRDKTFVEFDWSSRVSFKKGFENNSTGSLINVTAFITPTAGNRYIVRPKRVGELLDGPRKTYVPTVEQLLKGDIPRCKINEDSLDTYLRLFPQTQT